MKTLIIFLILVFSASISNAQEVTELDEAKVGFNPLSILSGDIKQITVKIQEKVPGEFEKDALAFMKANFDIGSYLSGTSEEEISSYQVTFKSKKGYLLADFDKDGNLVQTTQRFKNISLPYDLRNQLYNDHKGWAMVKNKFVAHGKMDKIDKAVYRITMQNGNKKRNLKYELGQTSKSTYVASN